MSLERDERLTANNHLVAEILKLLPGVDCGGRGGCGTESCSACASAIAESADCALCPACDQAAVDAIARVLGVPSREASDLKAFVACSGSAAGKGRYYNASSCADAVKQGFKAGECKDGCVGAGSCVDACKFGALSCSYGTVTVDRDKCTGCMACVDACPQRVIRMVPADATNFVPCSSTMGEEETRAVCGHGCIGCKDCEEACPRGAITVVDNHAVIDYDKCVGCVTCTVVCRKKIIVDTLHDLTKVKHEVAFVRCSGGANHERYQAMGAATCAQAKQLADGKAAGVCTFGCAGFGSCVDVCRYDAIHVVDGVAVVDPDRCVGCGDCTYACPNGLISLVPYKGAKVVACASTAPVAEKRAVCSSGCIGCSDCVDNCPNCAITMEGTLAVSDPTKCDNCNMCTYVCSRNVIREQGAPESVYLQRDALEQTGEEA